jgi:hypothetical protein
MLVVKTIVKGKKQSSFFFRIGYAVGGGTCPGEASQQKTEKIIQRLGHRLLKVNKQAKLTSFPCPTWAATEFW